jgi:GGDEF domain-containing protein
MNHEAGATMAKMRQQMLEMDQRLASTLSTDATTGLINRQELESKIEAHKLQGTVFSLLLFDLNGPISDQVLRMAAAKIAAQFRHRERVARWGYNQFAVLFLGESALAETRAQQVIPRVSGNYQLDNGETVLLTVQARLLQPDLQAA